MVRKIAVSGNVFPMRVGMVRFLATSYLTLDCFPHACGDGPQKQNLTPLFERFSPCVWGWSLFWQVDPVVFCVFPMRVGMVRIRLYGSNGLGSFPHACGDGPKIAV